MTPLSSLNLIVIKRRDLRSQFTWKRVGTVGDCVGDFLTSHESTEKEGNIFERDRVSSS